MGFHSLKDVLQEQLEELHSAETQLTDALPKMARAAHHDDLREAFEHHQEETLEHLRRVKEALSELGVPSPTGVCMGMKGLIGEGEEMMVKEGEPNAKDAALIGAAQRIEHYEIAAYGTARQLADDCGFGGIPDGPDARGGVARRQAPDEDRHRRQVQVGRQPARHDVRVELVEARACAGGGRRGIVRQ